MAILPNYSSMASDKRLVMVRRVPDRAASDNGLLIPGLFAGVQTDIAQIWLD